jgi:hypothetical protein
MSTFGAAVHSALLNATATAAAANALRPRITLLGLAWHNVFSEVENKYNN